MQPFMGTVLKKFNLAGTYAVNRIRSAVHRPYSRLFFVGDTAEWVLSWELKEVKGIAERLGLPSWRSELQGIFRQSVFFSNKYFLRKPETYFNRALRIALPYFHGYPSSGDPVHVLCYENLKKHHHAISRIQVSHTCMRDLILETGIEHSKVHLIPIGINASFFHGQTPESKEQARHRYGVPREAVVIGSFQKDGEGWGDGMNPKLIKGPDVFLKAVGILHRQVPELFVLLSGPSRGYVKQGLERLKIPYRHIYLRDYPEVGELYQCLDLYMVASREEGGPKAILESMASGVPLVTTSVGQAVDMVEHGLNALMVAVEDAEGLAAQALRILQDTALRENIIARGHYTVTQHTYEAQIPLWARFFEGFIDLH